jgi:2-succinyl-6-hydroxy-2,4-cyclohexadiene-1-carboxylate synthase
MSSELSLEATATSLAARSLGSSPYARVFVHGFAQTARCLGPFGELLADSSGLLAVDAPGHGHSVQHREASIAQGAELLCATAGRSQYIGYSMGGRISLHAAITHPELVSSLVLIGATAGIEDEQDRAQRREWDYQQAELLERVGLDAFLQSWLDQPLFVGLPESARFETERRTNTVAGLAASLRSAGTSSMTPLWDQLHLLQCPVLVLTGERDTRYCEIAEGLVAGIGSGATHVTIAGAGHAAHLEQPEATAAAVLDFQDPTEAPIQSPTDNNSA